MRICSLLPGLTDTLVALGVGDQIVAVTHECDVPAGSEIPAVTSSRIPAEATSAEIDRAVCEAGQGLYRLDEARLRALWPDLILTQKLCDVCAVNEAAVRELAGSMLGGVRVGSFQPTTLAEVLEMFRVVGELTGRGEQAEALVRRFQGRMRQVRERAAAWRERSGLRGAQEEVRGFRAPHPSPPPQEGREPVLSSSPGRWAARARVLCLEWMDPPFACGHWTPELVEAAGGVECLGRAGEPSYRTTWSAIEEVQPEVVVVAPCGYSIEQTLREWATLEANPVWKSLPAVIEGRTYVADGSRYFNRPGPRLLETLEILAAAISPEAGRGEAWAQGLVAVSGAR